MTTLHRIKNDFSKETIAEKLNKDPRLAIKTEAFFYFKIVMTLSAILLPFFLFILGLSFIY